jgi:hypothetical protein
MSLLPQIWQKIYDRCKTSFILMEKFVEWTALQANNMFIAMVLNFTSPPKEMEAKKGVCLLNRFVHVDS